MPISEAHAADNFRAAINETAADWLETWDWLGKIGKGRGKEKGNSRAHLCRRSCQRGFSHGGNSWSSSSIGDCETDAGTRRSPGSHLWPPPSGPRDFPWPVCAAFSSRSRTPSDPCEGRPATLAKSYSAPLPWRFPWEEKRTDRLV